jgi:MFS family permease
MTTGNITKICASSFFAGLIFWYGIEKLFMQDGIGITALGIGIAVATLQVTTVLFDIPFGILADLWSRKGVLIISVVAMMACSLLMGLSHSLLLYDVGVILYGIHVVTMFSTADSLLYDSLKNDDRESDYTRLGGRMEALNVAGYALGSVVSGFLATWLGYRGVYFLTVLPATLMLVSVTLIKEPRNHEAERAATFKLMRSQVNDARAAFAGNALLRALLTIMCLMWVGEVFKEGFGQLYILRYIQGQASMAVVLGVLWATFYFVWSLGSFFAHRFDGKLQLLIFVSVAPLIAMSFMDQLAVVVLFMVQAFAAGALFIQIGNLIHAATPSSVRTTVMSVKTFIGRLVTIPAIIFMGWATDHYDVRWALRLSALAAAMALLIWVRYSRDTKRLEASAVPASESM